MLDLRIEFADDTVEIFVKKRHGFRWRRVLIENAEGDNLYFNGFKSLNEALDEHEMFKSITRDENGEIVDTIEGLCSKYEKIVTEHCESL